MRITIGSDHRGFAAKQALVQSLRQAGHEVSDEGAHSAERTDYPDLAAAVARKVASGQADRGVLICGTGIGMAIAANKVPGVRAATCYDETTAELSRRHNDANVLCLSGDLLGQVRIDRMVHIWLATPFEGGRHARRLEKILTLEQHDAGSTGNA